MSYPHSEQDVAPAQADHGEGVSHIEPDDIGVGLLTVLVAFVAVVVLLIVVLLQAWFYNWKVELLGPADRPDRRATDARRDRRETTPADRNLRLGGPQDQQARAIPISRAMELVAKDCWRRRRQRGMAENEQRMAKRDTAISAPV